MPVYLGVAAYLSSTHRSCGHRPSRGRIVGALARPLSHRDAVRLSGVARLRPRLSDDHAGARPDPLGSLPTAGPASPAATTDCGGLSGRRRSASISMASHACFYYFTFCLVPRHRVWCIAASFSRLRAELHGTRDQPRRMRALGYNVWLIQWLSLRVRRILGRSPVCCMSTTTSSSARRPALHNVGGGRADGDRRRRRNAARAGGRRSAGGHPQERRQRLYRRAGLFCSASSSSPS